jgi:hypothetical protein
MMPSSLLLDLAITRIVELSADLHIKRRGTTKHSLEYHDHSVTIAAYGNVLAVLTALHQEEDCSAYFGLLGALDTAQETRAIA